MDVKSVFLNNELQEVYVSHPLGFVVAGEENKVLPLSKALYRLRQAPWAWYAKLDAALVALSIHRGELEHAVYMHGGGRSQLHRLIVGVYVITGSDKSELKQFKEETKSTFQMANLGLLRYYLRLEVSQGETGIWVSQREYARKILATTSMEGCNPSHTPMESQTEIE
jgi:hypothetical protein